jgi:uncharacterized membrane protein YgcG
VAPLERAQGGAYALLALRMSAASVLPRKARVNQKLLSAAVQVPPTRTLVCWTMNGEKMGNRLYVGNLSFSATEKTLRGAFAEHGDVTDVHVVIDRMTGQSRGFGFVTMGSQSEANTAMQALNGADLDGRSLKVNEAEERPSGGGNRGGGGGRGGFGGGGGGNRGGNRW